MVRKRSTADSNPMAAASSAGGHSQDGTGLPQLSPESLYRLPLPKRVFAYSLPFGIAFVLALLAFYTANSFNPKFVYIQTFETRTCIANGFGGSTVAACGKNCEKCPIPEETLDTLGQDGWRVVSQTPAETIVNDDKCTCKGHSYLFEKKALFRKR